MNFDFTFILMNVLAFITGVTIHEFAHAISAYWLGDDTPKKQERLSINPIDHLDPLGTIVFIASALIGTPFGWGKPVQTYPLNFKSPRWGMVIVAFAGPLSNIILAGILGLVIRNSGAYLAPSSVYFQLICRCVDINVLMFLFNLVPIPPLDGSKILAGILPAEMAHKYDQAMAQWGTVGFMILFFLGSRFIGPMVNQLSNAISDTVTVPNVIIQ